MYRVNYTTWDSGPSPDPLDDACDHCAEVMLGGSTVAMVKRAGQVLSFWCEACQRIPSLAAEIEKLKARDVAEALR